MARAPGLLLMVTASHAASARPYYSAEPPLRVGALQVLNGIYWNTVGGDMRPAPGATISCRVEGASDPDYDLYSYDGFASPGTVGEGVTRKWTASGGSFTGATNTLSMNWKAPPQAGTYRITFTLDDVNTPIGDADGSRDDAPATASISVIVTAPPHRNWRPDSAIRISGQSPFQNVASGATASFGVSGAGDSDDYRNYDDLTAQYGDWISNAGPDVVNYRWTCSPADAGQFASAANGASVSWRANPTSVTRAVTLTCTLDDPWTGTQTGVSAPDTGSRNDAPKPVEFRFSVLAATPTPTPRPTARPTATPTPRPTARPTATPTARPTATPRPTARPTATPTPRPTGTPRPTATPTPRPTATPTPRPTATPTARPTPVPLGISVSLSSDTPSICAGGIASPVHQAKLVATVRENGVALANRSVRFGWDMPGPAAPQSTWATTNAAGQASVTLTSGDEVGSVTLSATCEEKTTTKSIEVKAAVEDMTLNPRALVADGRQTAALVLNLSLNGKPVDQHRISWRISHVEDQNGVEVKPNAQGVFVGYGSVWPTSGVTNSSGQVATTYTVGTNAGVIEFEATDENVFESDGASNTQPSNSISGLASGTRRNKRYFERGSGRELTSSTEVLFNQHGSNSGFTYSGKDWRVEPNSLIVPAPGTSQASYLIWANGPDKGKRIDFVNGPIVQGRLSPPSTPDAEGVVTFTGLRKGRTTLDAIAYNGLAGRLDLIVKEKRIVTLTFYLCKDSAGHATKRSVRDIDSIIHEMNTIWTPQANVQFVKAENSPVNTLSIPNRLPAELSENHLNSIARLVPGPGKNTRNVFFVWAIAGDTLGIDPKFGLNLFTEDSDEYKPGLILAHEAGHSFQLRHPYELVNGEEPPALVPLRYRLMHPQLRNWGTTITNAEAAIVNP